MPNTGEPSLHFLGKWRWTSGSADSVQVDPTGNLIVGPTPSVGADRFNAYGTAGAFTLQASNGKFLALAGDTYVANKGPTDPVNRFTLINKAGFTAVVDLGVAGATTDPKLWNRSGAAIVPIAQSPSPPASTQFDTTVVTRGLDEILAEGFGSSPDLSWASLAGVDFTVIPAAVDLNRANLDHADFTDAHFPPGTPFHDATAAHADFTGATLKGCDLGNAKMPSAIFTSSHMSQIDLSGADLSGATLTDADVTRSPNQAQAKFAGGTLIRTDFTGAMNISETSFAGANLTGAKFKGASVTGWMDLTGADCTGMTLCNPADRVTVFPKYVLVNAKTNFHGANLQRLDFSGYNLSDVNFAHANLTGCKLDNATLDRTNFGYATLDHATFTGGISLHGANLANASMRAADLTGAQLGSVSQAFRVGADAPNYSAFLTALRTGDGVGVSKVFADEHFQPPLTGTVTVRAMVFAPDTAWQVLDASRLFLVFLESVGGIQSLNVYQPTTAAVLANAFMVDVNLKSANLYGVRASGAQLYATAGNKVNLNQAKVNGLQANNANLGGIDLSQANLAGCNFDYTVLTGASFVGATLGVDANGGQPSFNGANLQGANFSTAVLRDAILANAAVAVANPKDPDSSAGVWLFEIAADQAPLISPQLIAASKDADTYPDVPTELLPTMLTAGPVPPGIRVAFKDANINLAADALLVILTTELFWVVTAGQNTFAVFRSVNDDYQPALGVAQGSDYTLDADFYIPLSLEASLRNGQAAQSLLDAFKAAGHALGTVATVTTSQHPLVWQIVSGADTYSLWIAFDSTAKGVDTKIITRPSIPNVIATFGQASIAVSNRASVNEISGAWKVRNDSENPFNPARGYIEFNVLPNDAGGLEVYGSLMRIVRSTGQGAQEFTNVPCDITQLGVRELAGSGGTICPNGATVAANQGDNLPLERWMWARYLPRPPVCVPDPQGKFFCPS